MRYQFVQEHKGRLGVKEMCQVLGVSRSGYYAWAVTTPGKTVQQANTHREMRC